MFYKVKIKDYVRVPPNRFGLGKTEAVRKSIREAFEGMISKDMGFVIDVASVDNVGEGVIIPGDGSSYYDTEFQLYTFKPEMQEVLNGKVKDIADFGVFLNVGPVEGMIHVSQTMNDFVSFSKDKVLSGKESKRSLKVNDKCRARIIAVSFKDMADPKIGMTMRQEGLGKLEWIEEDVKKADGTGEKEIQKEEKTKKGKGKKSR